MDQDRLTIVVSKDQSRVRLDRYLLCQGWGATRSQLQRMIHSGAVLVDGRVRPPGYLVKPGDRISWTPAQIPRERPKPEAEAIPLSVVYEDEDLLVVDKPAGMVVHPAPGNYRGTLVNALLGRRTPLAETSEDRPGIVHRLDKETSGLLIVAKNQEAHHRLAAQLSARTLKRTYLALVWGILEGQGTIEAPIGRSTFDRQRMAVTPLGGRRAVTHWRALNRYGRLASLIQVDLETGRTHQIRVHCEHIGHPVIGDPTYRKGVSQIRRGLDQRETQLAEGLEGLMGRQALHAYRLRFHHPRTGQSVELESRLPPDFHRLIEILKDPLNH